jgi:hypothetical protein
VKSVTKATEVKSLGLWLVTGMCVGCGVFKLLSIEHEVNVTKKNYLLQSATPIQTAPRNVEKVT